MKSILKNSNGRKIIKGDKNSIENIRDLIFLISMYRHDSMGDGKEFSSLEMKNLEHLIKSTPDVNFYLIYLNGELGGGAITFKTFSSFSAKHLINIHDFFIVKNFRKVGLGSDLLKEIIADAKDQNCCKVTLEVREDNLIAQDLYKKTGFLEAMPNMLFWHSPIT
ncbi:MAG: GNAT family N-acetyltransferase [Spirochaetales bacterium]|nr:GNAT family N-acetyltransferase [Spirochaetales bacterium]